MAVIVDLDDDESPAVHPSADASGFPKTKPVHHSLVAAGNSERDTETVPENTRPNPNINGFSAALSCYPIASQLASQLDLNTLHDLSRTCRQFRANLLEYRDQLVKNSLHCVNDKLDVGASRASQAYSSTGRQLTSGRVSRCARDMVADCRRCETVVCRNCVIKPPKHTALQARHRRLCRSCSKATLDLLTSSRACPTSTGMPSSPTSANNLSTRAFTASAFERTPCSCDSTVWLCQPCGQNLRNEDTMYLRTWTWRTRYSHYLGGVGTGAGEGNEFVKCGRGSQCLSAKIVEHETDYDPKSLPTAGTSDSPERWKGTSYHAQEIEGIGGVLKMKAKKQFRVGECVRIYEDEKDQSIQYLTREVGGKLRSWCAWCERVITSAHDLTEAACGRPTSSGSSSASFSKSES